ncbi:MAG: 2-phosphosulfolactate phosphatase [Desulfuromonadales bacterium]|nr:2-phosphosulfolactate phosphatase [Desulfuromonadales bacterium]
MPGSFVIDAFPESASIYRNHYTIVAIDVIRATTTAVTALDLGHRLFAFATLEEARQMAAENPEALLVGEQKGVLPAGFHLTNSPYQLAGNISGTKTIILVSSSGTRLMSYAVGLTPVLIGCFRNLTALARHLITHHQKVALIGAGSKNDFRREDQMGCAYLGQKLMAAGYEPENERTTSIVDTWAKVDHREAAHGRSAGYLKRSGQEHDLKFIIDHFDDLNLVPVMKKQELVVIKPAVIPIGIVEDVFPQQRCASDGY